MEWIIVTHRFLSVTQLSFCFEVNKIKAVLRQK